MFKVRNSLLSTESTEYFPVINSNFFFKSFVTVSVAPVITGKIVHFIFHFRCISIHKRFVLFPFARARARVCVYTFRRFDA